MLAATVHVESPSATPPADATPHLRPPESVFRIVSAVSWPGVQMTTAETATNASEALEHGRSIARRLSIATVAVRHTGEG